MSRQLQLDICDYGRHSLCNIYDNNSNIVGQAYDVFINSERNGWKELEFNIPSVINGPDGEETNYRLDYLVADYFIKATDDYETDWFIISEPKITHNNFSKTVSVRAGHISQLLKTKNLELEFSDAERNNVGTAADFLSIILEGTGWQPGEVKEFLEDDKVTIKKRTLNASSKTGALKLINDLCELFDAKAVYHGDNKTVDILPLNPFSEEYTEGTTPKEVNIHNSIELHYNKNVKSITRTLNTENMVTKLYAYGSYGDVDTGICNIKTCTHMQYTFTIAENITSGTEFKFKDNTDAWFYFTADKDIPAGTTLLWSKIDLLSRSYVWDGTDFFTVYKQPKMQNQNLIEGEVEEIRNYVPYLMNFEYYRKIGLLTDDMFRELIKYQVNMPSLYQASEEASYAYQEQGEKLSRVGESNTGFLKLAVNSYDEEEGDLVVNIDITQGDHGVLYRTDYAESKANYFTWYVADQIKDNGDSLSGVGSKLLILKKQNDGPDEWDFAYLKKINRRSGSNPNTVVDKEGKPTHYYYSLTEGGEPNQLVLHFPAYDAGVLPTNHEIFLFCSNSMTGMLGTNMATDESILQTLDKELTDETVKHPVFFTTSNPSSQQFKDEFTEYAWVYKFDKYHNNTGNLFYWDKIIDTAWKTVFFGDELPPFNPSIHPDMYFFSLKEKTLWHGGATEWLQMTTAKDERRARMFSLVIHFCKERDRIYKGWAEKYSYTGSLPIGNYAVKNEYGEYWLFTTTQNIDNEVYIDTNHMWLYQDNDPEHVVSVLIRQFDVLTFPTSNILPDKYVQGTLSDVGVETYDDEYIRSGFMRVYAGTQYQYNLPSCKLYYYDQNKTCIGSLSLSGTGTFIPLQATGNVASDQYTAAAYYIRITSKTEPEVIHYIRIKDYAFKVILSDKVYTIVDGFTVPEDAEYTGINNLLTRFKCLANEIYGPNGYIDALTSAQNAITKANKDISDVLGDILREGYWQDDNYVEGDEERLYKDAMDNLKEISKPETTYDIEFLDLYSSNENMGFALTDETQISWPDLQATYAVHLIDEDLDTSCWAYIDSLNKCYDQPWRTTMQINTKLSLIDQHDFSDVMSHIADVAKETKAKQSIYQRAASLSGSGQLAAEKLSGTLNAYKTLITGGSSSWETNEKGQMIFSSADNTSAMMLTGNGLMVADTKDKYGDWEWKTAITGAGIVADSITTGVLSAMLLEAGGITTDHISSTFGSDLDISSNQALALYATIDGERPAGALKTTDAIIEIRAGTAETDAYINIASGGKLDLTGGTVNIASNTNMNFASGKNFVVNAGGAIILNAGTTFTVSSDKFKIDGDGNVEMSGKVTATSGKIAGFEIDDRTEGDTVINFLYSGTSSMSSNAEGVYLGTDGINLAGKFKVTKEGYLTSTFGTIGGWTITDDSLYNATYNESTAKYSSYTGMGIGTYAFWAGGSTDANQNLSDTIKDNSPFWVKNDGSIKATSGTIGGWTLSSSSLTATNVGLSTGERMIWAGGTSSTTDANMPFYVKNNGTLKATLGSIGGWTVSATKLSSGSGTTTVALDSGTANVDYAIWAGHATNSSAPFWVKRNGSIKATSGTVGGWTLSTTSLSTTTVGLSTGTYSFWAGNATSSSAPFWVKSTGEIKAASGTVGGWSIDSKYLYASSGASTVKLDGSTDTYALSWYNKSTGATTSTNHMFAIWAGNASATSAPFSVTKDGVVTIKKLRAEIASGKYVEVNLSNFITMDDAVGTLNFDWNTAMGKLKFQTIKNIRTNNGKLELRYTNDSGGTSLYTFEGVALLAGSWSDNNWIIKNTDSGSTISRLCSNPIGMNYRTAQNGTDISHFFQVYAQESGSMHYLTTPSSGTGSTVYTTKYVSLEQSGNTVYFCQGNSSSSMTRTTLSLTIPVSHSIDIPTAQIYTSGTSKGQPLNVLKNRYEQARADSEYVMFRVDCGSSSKWYYMEP